MHIIFQAEHPFSLPLQLSYQIIAKARRKDWDSVVALNNRYVITLREAIEHIQSAGMATYEEEGRMNDIEQLLNNEKEIRALIGARLTTLEQDMGQLRHNSQGNNAYHRQLLQS